MRVPTYAELYDDSETRIKAALVIHAPCHGNNTEQDGCVHGYWNGEWNAYDYAGEIATCISCTYDDRTVTYPCPPAIALGVATEASKEN